MSLLREVKPRNARTARIVKSREPQVNEERKRILILHGTKNPPLVQSVLRTFSTLTKPHSVLLTKKNADIHPFEDPSSLEFLALKNDCALVVFGTHSKKRPNNVTVLRIYDGKTLDAVELLLLNGSLEEVETHGKNIQIGVEMKPLMLFAGSAWDDTSVSDSATLFRTLKSTFLDVFQGEEIRNVDVAGLQYLLMIAVGESDYTSTSTSAPASARATGANSEGVNINGGSSATGSGVEERPVLHLRWYRVRTLRSSTPKIPRVELDPIGPVFDFRVGRFKSADPDTLRDAMKHGKNPNEAGKTKKNIETDIMGDKLGRVHLGKQDLAQLQTRKMKGLKRGRGGSDDEDEDGDVVVLENGGAVGDDEDLDVDGGVEVDVDEDMISDGGDGGSSEGGTGDEIDIDSGDDEDEIPDEMPKRQRVR